MKQQLALDELKQARRNIGSDELFVTAGIVAVSEAIKQMPKPSKEVFMELWQKVGERD